MFIIQYERLTFILYDKVKIVTIRQIIIVSQVVTIFYFHYYSLFVTLKRKGECLYK